MQSSSSKSVIRAGTTNQPLSKYLTRIFHGQVIRQRDTDGYVNMTDMSKASGKIVKGYNQSKRGKDMMLALREHLGDDFAGIKVSLGVFLGVALD